MEELEKSWQKTPFFVRWLAIGSTLASIFAVASTVYISSNANRLQQGDNTIDVIAAYGSETVRASRSALYEISRQNTVDPARRALSFAQVAPLRGALGFVATCYRDNLCLRSTVVDYFCVDVLKYDDIFGSGAPALQQLIPDAADVAFNTLVDDCRQKETKS